MRPGQVMPDGLGTFADAIVRFRNRSIHTYVGHIIQFRQQALAFGEFGQESGWSDSINRMLIDYLARLDDLRIKITRNPAEEDIGNLRETIKGLGVAIPDGPQVANSSVTADDVARGTGPEFDLRYVLDGTDPDVPMIAPIPGVAQVVTIDNVDARMFIVSLDLHASESTRLDSRDATYRITAHESLMLYESLSDLVDMATSYGGDSQRLPVPHGVRPSEEPRGPIASPNREEQA